MATTPIPQRTGLALPVVNLNGGYLAARGKYDLAWSDLLVAAFCPVGGRFMRRALGSSVADYLMAPADAVTYAAIRDAIVSAAARQCPYVRIRDINVSRGATPRIIQIAVSFALSTDPDSPQQRVAQLDREMVFTSLRVATAG